MKLTDEAVEAGAEAYWESERYADFEPAWDALCEKDGDTPEIFRRHSRTILEAALPHLTDDGAVSPPADPTGAATPSAAERATPVCAGEAAPSSPHLEGATPVAHDQRAEISGVLTSHRILWTRTDSTVACACDPAAKDMRLPVNWRTYDEFAAHQTEAVLALIGGAS
jgi:hypothetical protein